MPNNSGIDTPFDDYLVSTPDNNASSNKSVVDGEVQGPYKKRTPTPNSPSVATRDSNMDKGANTEVNLFTDALHKRAG
jgi:hypothetical protein